MTEAIEEPPDGRVPPVGALPATTAVAAQHVAVLRFNPFTHDSRVRNLAQTLADTGCEVVVVAVEAGTEPPAAVHGTLRVVRLPFDPLYRQAWDERAAVLRPWRHAGRIVTAAGSWLASGSFVSRLLRGATLVLVGVPWVSAMAAYHGAARLVRAVRRAIRRPMRGRAGAWLEERYRRFVSLAPHAVRVATWSRYVLAAYQDGTLQPADVWHANDLETLPVALLLRRRFGGRVVYDSLEIWLEMPGPRRMGRARRWLLARSEGWMARSADARATINEALADELQRRWRSERPVVIRSVPPRWALPADAKAPLRKALEDAGIDPGLPIVLSHGNLVPGRGVQPLVSAMEHLDGFVVAFLGRGPLAGTVQEMAATRWKRRLALLPVVPPDHLLTYVAGADVSACLIEPTSLSLRLAGPNKLYQAIAAGVPLVASDFGPIREDVERYQVGVTCDPSDPASIAAAIGHLLGLPRREYEALRSNARRAHLDELNWERESERLLVMYEALAPVHRRQSAGVDHAPRP
jgi:glycosyltransferase involved in cell wall biosynthesis